MSLFTEEKQKQAPLSSVAEEEENRTVGVTRSETEKSFLCIVVPFNTLTPGKRHSALLRSEDAEDTGVWDEACL